MCRASTDSATSPTTAPRSRTARRARSGSAPPPRSGASPRGCTSRSWARRACATSARCCSPAPATPSSGSPAIPGIALGDGAVHLREFTIDLSGAGLTATGVVDALRAEGIEPGVPVGEQRLLVCVTEMTSQLDIDRLAGERVGTSLVSIRAPPDSTDERPTPKHPTPSFSRSRAHEPPRRTQARPPPLPAGELGRADHLRALDSRRTRRARHRRRAGRARCGRRRRRRPARRPSSRARRPPCPRWARCACSSTTCGSRRRTSAPTSTSTSARAPAP